MDVEAICNDIDTSLLIECRGQINRETYKTIYVQLDLKTVKSIRSLVASRKKTMSTLESLRKQIENVRKETKNEIDDVKKEIKEMKGMVAALLENRDIGRRWFK